MPITQAKNPQIPAMAPKIVPNSCSEIPRLSAMLGSGPAVGSNVGALSEMVKLSGETSTDCKTLAELGS